jgi:hypothetical protein
MGRLDGFLLLGYESLFISKVSWLANMMSRGMKPHPANAFRDGFALLDDALTLGRLLMSMVRFGEDNIGLTSTHDPAQPWDDRLCYAQLGD